MADGKIVINEVNYSGVTASEVNEIVGDLINGIIVPVEVSGWMLQTDGTYRNIVTVEQLTGTETIDVSLYGEVSEEQAEAFDFLITSIDCEAGQIIFTASERIEVALSVLIRGRVDLENKNVYVSDMKAVSVEYDNELSGLDSTDAQNAIDELATAINGLVINISADSWDLQEDGTYKKIVAIDQLTGNETLDVCLYPGDVHTEEQIVAFSELLSSIETYNGFIVLTAVEEINVSFRIFLYGKVNFDKNNLVALTDNYIDIVPISEEEFNKKSDAEKAAGNYLVDDGEDDEFLSARNMSFEGSEISMEADNVHDAISELNSNLSNQSKRLDDLSARMTVLEDKYGDFVPIETLSGIVSGSMTAYGSSATVAFETPFYTIPTVNASLNADKTYISYSISNITRAGFTYTVYSSQHSSCNYTLSWVAEAEY